MAPQHTSRSEAVRIYQELLDTLSDAMMASDLATVRARIKLPFVRRTLASEVIIETAADMDRGTLAGAQSLLARGVNQFIRLASDAEFLSPHYIEGYHVTHLLRNAMRVAPSYSNRVVMQNDHGVWKLTELDSELENTEWPYKMLSVPERMHNTIRLPIDPDDMRRTNAEPLALYQQFLDALTKKNVEDDFDGYCGLCSFPYTTHHDNSDIVMESRKDVRPAFDTITELLGKYEADKFERRGERAEFISGNLICGYHTSRFFRRGLVVMGPIHSRMILERTGPHWRLKSVTNSVTNETYPYSDPVTVNTLVTIREIQERQRQ